MGTIKEWKGPIGEKRNGQECNKGWRDFPAAERSHQSPCEDAIPAPDRPSFSSPPPSSPTCFPVPMINYAVHVYTEGSFYARIEGKGQAGARLVISEKRSKGDGTTARGVACAHVARENAQRVSRVEATLAFDGCAPANVR